MDASYPLSVDSPVPTIRYRWFTDSANFSGGCRSRIHGAKKGGGGGGGEIGRWKKRRVIVSAEVSTFGNIAFAATASINRCYLQVDRWRKRQLIRKTDV